MYKENTERRDSSHSFAVRKNPSHALSLSLGKIEVDLKTLSASVDPAPSTIFVANRLT